MPLTPTNNKPKNQLSNAVPKVFLLLIIGALLFALQRFDFQSIAQTICEISILKISSFFALAFVQIGLQAARLWCLLPRSVNISYFSFFGIHVRGQLINQVLPARAGDVLKANILKKAVTEKNGTVSLSELFGSVLLTDKIADLAGIITLLFLFSPSWVLHAMSDFDLGFTTTKTLISLMATLVVGSLCYYLYKRKFEVKLKLIVSKFLDGLKQSFEARKFIAAFVLALGSWLTEVAILLLLTQTLNLDLEFSQAIVVLGILNLGIAIPLSFANLGTYEGALAFGLSRFGVSITSAFACSIIYHFVQLTALIISYFVTELLKKVMKNVPAFRVRFQDKEKAINYFRARSDNYSETTSKGLFHHLRSKEKEAITKYLDLSISRNKNLLDVGCGNGRYSLLAKSAGLHVTAVDVNEDMVSQLQEKVDHCYVADIEHLKTNEQFDIVLCVGVLDFVLNPKLAFDKLCELVKPGGRLILLLPKNSWLFGTLYRIEKKCFGFQVNLFHE